MANEEFDRVTSITARIVEGTIPKSTILPIIYLGMREEFIPADSEESMQEAGGEIFAVVKSNVTLIEPEISDGILLEDGSGCILLEDGFYLKLEN